MKAKINFILVPVTTFLLSSSYALAKKVAVTQTMAAYPACRDVLLVKHSEYDKAKAGQLPDGCVAVGDIPDLPSNGDIAKVLESADYGIFLKNVAGHLVAMENHNIPQIKAIRACFEDSKKDDADCAKTRDEFLNEQREAASKMRVQLALTSDNRGAVGENLASAEKFESHLNKNLGGWNLIPGFRIPTPVSAAPLTPEETAEAKAIYEKDVADIMSQLKSKFDAASSGQKAQLFKAAYYEKVKQHRDAYLDLYYTHLKPLAMVKGAKFAQGDPNPPSFSDVRKALDELVKQGEHQIQLSEDSKKDVTLPTLERAKRAIDVSDNRSLFDHMKIVPLVNDYLMQFGNNPAEHAKQCGIAQALYERYQLDEGSKSFWGNYAMSFLGGGGLGGGRVAGRAAAEGAWTGRAAQIAKNGGAVAFSGGSATAGLALAFQPILGAAEERSEARSRFMSSAGTKSEKALINGDEFKQTESAVSSAIKSTGIGLAAFGGGAMVGHYLAQNIVERMAGKTPTDGFYGLMRSLRASKADPRKVEAALDKAEIPPQARDEGKIAVAQAAQTNADIEKAFAPELAEVVAEDPAHADEAIGNINALAAEVKAKTGKSYAEEEKEIRSACPLRK